jgi:excisionase family DNA binding protein
MNNTYYTVEQVADLLSLHPKTVQRYIREGKLRATKLGKGWRVAGHDLSVFAENVHPAGGPVADGRGAGDVTVSAVADIRDSGREAAIRVMNALTASVNAKPPEYGRSSLHTQYIETEAKVRVTLWGGARFTAVMMDAVAALTESEETE